jgi:hypothetical protein
LKYFLLEGNNNIGIAVNTMEDTSITHEAMLEQQNECVEFKEIITISPWNSKTYNLKFKSFEKHVRKNITIIALIDISYSMNGQCSSKEDSGYSKLDLIIHSLGVLLEKIETGDELICITFDHCINDIFKSSEYSKEEFKKKINTLRPIGGTNIWDALKRAFEEAANSANKENTHILLLTDGDSEHPNNHNELQKYYPQYQTLNIKLTTVGYSSAAKTEVLFNIAEYVKSGGLIFIFDYSMVCSSLCNFYINAAYPNIKTCIIQEQELTSLPLTDFDDMHANDKYELVRFHCYQVLKAIASNNIVYGNELFRQFLSWLKILSSTEIILPSDEFPPGSIVPDLQQSLLKCMILDFESSVPEQEQIKKALETSYNFESWGRHYLRSLSLAHLTRTCHNSKDQGVQLYANIFKQNLFDEMYEIFGKLKPPAPSLAIRTPAYQSTGWRASANPVSSQITDIAVSTTSSIYERPIQSMATLASRDNGGCFAPNCEIRLENKKYKKLSQLDGTEKVYQGDDIPGASIKYIIKFDVNAEILMSQIYTPKHRNDLIISPYHPYYESSSECWFFPSDTQDSTLFYIDYIINIVLENGYWVDINGIKCVSLGHGLQKFNDTETILKHEYFGTNNVIEDLEVFKINEKDKIINVSGHRVLRDKDTDHVNQIVRI